MPRNGEWRLIEVGTVCWIGTESCLSRIGNLGRTDLLKVGEEGAVCGREGGKGLSTITGRVLLGLFIWEGVWISSSESSPL